MTEILYKKGADSRTSASRLRLERRDETQEFKIDLEKLSRFPADALIAIRSI